MQIIPIPMPPVPTPPLEPQVPSFFVKDVPIVLDDNHVNSVGVRSGIHFGHFLYDISNERMEVVIKVAIDSIRDLEHEVSAALEIKQSTDKMFKTILLQFFHQSPLHGG